MFEKKEQAIYQSWAWWDCWYPWGTNEVKRTDVEVSVGKCIGEDHVKVETVDYDSGYVFFKGMRFGNKILTIQQDG